jgi:RNA polymerase sigma factor (sigma-70 family)
VYADNDMWDLPDRPARRAPDPDLVQAAREGDAEALDLLLAGVFPLVYNIVGRALDGHADVDDVVQETLLRVVRGLGTLREADSFRSWVVAIAVRQVRDRQQERRRAQTQRSPLDSYRDLADPAADFVAAGQRDQRLAERRRVFAQAVRWLEPGHRTVLSLWWLEELGELDRTQLAEAAGVSSRHAAVRVLRMKEQMQTSCMVVKALQGKHSCRRLRALIRDWDGEPGPLWRKRIARHVRDCDACWQTVGDLLPVEGLARIVPPLPVPVDLGLRWTTAAQQAAAAHGYSVKADSAARHHPSATQHPARERAVTRHGPQQAGRDHPSVPRPRGHLGVGAHGGLLPITVAAVVVGAVVGGYFAIKPGAPTRPAAAVGNTALPPVAAPSPQSRQQSAAPNAVPSPSLRTVSHSAVAAAPLIAASPQGKKGVGANPFDGVDSALAESKADWYYTWSTDHDGIATPPGVGFVPMIWGAKSVTSAQLRQATAAGPYLLGFNEPDLASQADMTVGQALDLWPQLMSAGKVLGSPAVAYGAADSGSWLDQFMSGAQQRGYRVDFITLHWYGADFVTADAVGQLKSYIQAVWKRYHKPIWLTEFALISFDNGTHYPSDQQQAAFLTAAAQMLSGLSYVQRYAWFDLPAGNSGPSSGLFRDGPSVTPEGRAFESAAGG